MSVVAVSDGDFDKTVLQSAVPVLVDFWAPWCGPCRMVGPVVDELSKEYEGKITFAKIDVDQNPKTAAKYRIMSIPALIVFKKGEPVSHVIGFKPKPELKKSLDAALA